ncbi:MAG: choice-of-anchor Q domain-containing protein [Kiritimatiellia bacterium]
MKLRFLYCLAPSFFAIATAGVLVSSASFANATVLPDGGPWYVGPNGSDTANDGLSQETPFATLEKAIQTADENGSGTIYLAPGTYAPSGYISIIESGTGSSNNNGFALTNAIAIIGQGASPDETVVTNNATKVRPFYLAHENARIENLAIIGGIATASIGGNVFIDKAGGTVSNCRIANGNATAWNAGGGNIAMFGGRVTRCFISGGRCDPDTLNAGRRGGSAIYMNGGQVDNSLITANANGYAPIICNGSSVIGNCTISGNTGTACAGIYINSSTASIVNTIIYGNSASSDSTGHGHIYIAAKDAYTSVFSSCLSEIAINENCFETQSVGFADAASGDYSLTVASPARDAGQTFDAGELDLAGNPRISNGLVDIGCYEFDASQKTLDFTADRSQGHIPLTVFFHASVTGDDIANIKFEWDLNGDGTIDVSKTGDVTAEWTYTDAALYTVTLRATIDGETLERTQSDCVKTASSVIYVDAAATAPQSPYSTPETALASIPDALDLAVDGCEIRVLPGIYTQTSPIEVTKAVRLEGMSANPEHVVLTNIVSAGWNNYDKKNLLVANKDAFVCNFLLVNGQSFEGTLSAGLVINNSGGTVSNCIIRGSKATRLMNTYAGGACIQNGLLTHSIIEQCTIDPTASTGSGRRAQAIAVSGSGSVENCLVRDCINTFGSAVLAQDNALVRNSTIVNCQVAYDLRNTGSGNQTNTCWGLSCEGNAKAENCAIFDVKTIAYNDIAEGLAPWGGAGSFVTCAADADAPSSATDCQVGTAQAAFTDYDAGNLLPAINGILWNKGTLAETDVTALDLAGKPRLVGKSIDIGCFERSFAALFILLK